MEVIGCNNWSCDGRDSVDASVEFDKMRKEIIHDDMLNLVKYVSDESVDLCIFDPPYGIGKNQLHFSEKNWLGYKMAKT